MKRIISVLLCALLVPAFCACSPSIPVPDDPTLILRDGLMVCIAENSYDCLIPFYSGYFNDVEFAIFEEKELQGEYADREGTQKTVTIFGREHTGLYYGNAGSSLGFKKDVMTQERMPPYLTPEGFVFYCSEETGRVVHFYVGSEYEELLRAEHPDAEELTMQQISANCIEAIEAEYGSDGWIEVNRELPKNTRFKYKFTFARQQDGVNVEIIRLYTNIYGEMMQGDLLPGRPAELPDSVPVPDWPEETYKELILKKLTALYKEEKAERQYAYEAVFTDVQIHPNGYTYYYLTEYESHAIEVSFDCSYTCDGASYTEPCRMLILYDA